jgi:hypothetical protein
MISHHQQVNGRIMRVSGDSDRLRGQESSALDYSLLGVVS